MSEWWTYTASNFLLFSPTTYYRLFELYNGEIWPGQILAILLGLTVLALLERPTSAQSCIISAILAACWLWVGSADLFTRYASINWAATYFAAAFAVEALLLILIGAVGGRLSLRSDVRWVDWAGTGLFFFALVIEPLVGPLVGRSWSQVEIFAIAPNPTVVATVGMLILAGNWSKWVLMVIPLMWCLLSGATAWVMKSADAPLMPLAAACTIFVTGLAASLRHRRSLPRVDRLAL
jgi:Family of unknown function (DUF6064)